MDLLERIWEYTGLFFSGLLRTFERSVTSVFGSSNARYIRRLHSYVESINSLEAKYQALSDAELRDQTDLFRKRLAAGETLDDLLVEAFAVCREAGRRFLTMRHFDVQLIGGIVLHRGAIAEMITGEGKTLVATLPAYLNALEGKGVHVVTVNDYLARRDMEWMGPLYLGLGLTVGAIQSDMPVSERQKAYACDITYGTNNEFGFDYLRDNMRPAMQGDHRYPPHLQQSQRTRHFAIIDEVDNILIDEARTPLIISGPAHDDIGKYVEADRVARLLIRDKHFEVNEKDHHVTLSDDGVREAEKLAGVESFYTVGNMEWPHLIDNALKAHYLYKRDVNYVIKEQRIVIVDEFTGRLMEGRQWSDGLHQAVEAKERVPIKEETQTLATITLQNYFKLYTKLGGMTGTAMTEATEFWKIYKLDVIAIPPNRQLKRIEHIDMIFCTEEEKFRAVADEIERLNRWDGITRKGSDTVWGTIEKETDDQVVFRPRDTHDKQTIERREIVSVQRKGRPVLVGTVSIEKSESLSGMLDRRGIEHNVLNAKQHKREASIIAQAGRIGAVTIATNMAGRGTDIVLGGNPETLAWAQLQDKYETRLDVPRDEWDRLVAEIESREKMREEGAHVKELGGLHVIGTERHEARRIDLQLRGRCGRQGDPGSSRFYLSLRDDLMRIFAGPFVEKMLKTLGMPEGEAIESRMVTRRIEAAQKKVEERNFEIRKNLLEYDEVMDEQRKRVYRFRQDILEGADCKQIILDMVRQEIDRHVSEFLEKDYGAQVFASFASSRLATPMEATHFRGLLFEDAVRFAKDEAERIAETQVQDAVDENLPSEEDPSEWNWGALAKMANARWNLNLRDRDLIKIGRDTVDTTLLEHAQHAIRQTDLSEGERFLEPNFGHRTVCGWIRHKFGLEVPVEEIQDRDADHVIDMINQKAIEAYEMKESEYPILAGLYRFSTRVAGGQTRIDRQQLVDWARDRFNVELDLEDIKSKQRNEIRALLIDHSRQHQQQAGAAWQAVQEKIEQLYSHHHPEQTAGVVSGGNGALDSLSRWIEQQLQTRVSPDEIAGLDRQQLERKLQSIVEERYRPEMRRMERAMVLELVDTAWKDHLLAMDHLRSAVGLVGYAQVDPKVEYKREGMRLYKQMWMTLHQRITDLVYRIEQLDENFVGSTWVETAAVHERPQAAMEVENRERSPSDPAPSSDTKVEPIRNRSERVGRNDPCPCGSGKKYKSCCLRK